MDHVAKVFWEMMGAVIVVIIVMTICCVIITCVRGAFYALDARRLDALVKRQRVRPQPAQPQPVQETA